MSFEEDRAAALRYVAANCANVADVINAAADHANVANDVNDINAAADNSNVTTSPHANNRHDDSPQR